MAIQVFGHKSPDTDSVGSAILWAWYLSKVKEQPAVAKMVEGPLNSETRFVLDHWGITSPKVIQSVHPDDDVVIVDTNNINELPKGIENANIIEIIDHHLLQGGLSTRKPLTMTLRPLASTASILSILIGDDNKAMPLSLKGIMLSCILSDTLAFRSPTTTEFDKNLAVSLANDVSVDIQNYSDAMFKAKSDVSHLSDMDILQMDSKAYSIGALKLRISVLETVIPETILNRKTDLLDAMQFYVTEHSKDVDEILFFIVDIFNECAIALLPNERVQRIIENSFTNVELQDNTARLPGVISRKKQIIPSLKI